MVNGHTIISLFFSMNCIRSAVNYLCSVMISTVCSSLQLIQSVTFLHFHPTPLRMLTAIRKISFKAELREMQMFFLRWVTNSNMFHDLYIDYLQLFKSHYWLPLSLHLQEQWIKQSSEHCIDTYKGSFLALL